MSIHLIEVNSKRDLLEFIKFQYNLYKYDEYFVPPLINEELDTFMRNRNPAYEHSDAKFILAKNESGNILGRIALIDNRMANKKWGTKNLRFGWIEFVEDLDILEALLSKAEDWAIKLGYDSITGPHGFSDLDPQGMLIEGFDRLPTIAAYYHKPYYYKFMERFGFIKDVDFVEFWSTSPTEITPSIEKLFNAAEWIEKKKNFHLANYPSKKQYQQRGRELFRLLEESFSENYGTTPLSEKQIDYYIKKYITYINKDLIKYVLNQKDELIGFLITMPSLSKAYQKAKGKLYPTGFIHILRALKTYEILDFYLAGVKKEYRGLGVDVIMAADIVKTAMRLGFKHAESNQELETNTKVQSEWKFFNPVLHKRRRIYKKIIK